MENEITKRASEPFQRSAEVERLVRAFVAMAEGDSMTYLEVQAIIMEDPQLNRGRSITMSARRIARKEFKVIVKCEIQKGFIRVSNELIPELPAEHRQRVQTRLKVASEELGAVDVGRLENGMKTKYYTEVSWVGAMRLFSKPKAVKQIGDTVKNSELNYGDVLKLFAG